MKTFLEYLKESRLKEKAELLIFKFKNITKCLKSKNDDIRKSLNLGIEQMLSKFCSMAKIDKDKFIKENSKKIDKITNIILPSKNAKFMPLCIAYYDTTDTYILIAKATSGSLIKKLLMLPFGVLGSIYLRLSGNGDNIIIIPIKPLNADVPFEIDMSAKAIGLLAMILLLSDIDCNVVWPLKLGKNTVEKAFIKTLDFICPSIIDLLSLCTLGGASVASRVAKLSKYGAKVGSKAMKVAAKSGSKVAKKTISKKMAKNGLKATAKSKNVLKKIPKPIRKFLTANKNKLKSINKTSRTIKKDIHRLIYAKLKYDEVKAEIMSMSTDDLFAFSYAAVKILLKTYLPKEKKDLLDKLMTKIPDSVIDKVSTYAKNKVKEKRDEDVMEEVTMLDVIISAIPEDLKDKFKTSHTLV